VAAVEESRGEGVVSRGFAEAVEPAELRELVDELFRRARWSQLSYRRTLDVEQRGRMLEALEIIALVTGGAPAG
jgi:hypothetical protein